MEYQTFRHKPGHNNIELVCQVKVNPFLGRKLVVVKELPENPGMSICNAFESLFKAVTRQFELYPKEVIWVEHWPAWSASEGGYDRTEEEYSLVVYSLIGNEAHSAGWRPLTEAELAAVKSL
jgi:hypothetical protein